MNAFNREKSILDATKIGDFYLYPASDGHALLCEVVGLAEKAVVAKFGESKVYVDMNNWKQFAVPMKEIKVMDRIEDPDNKLLFVRYRNNSTWIDKLYNWYVGNREDGKDFGGNLA